MLARLGWKDNHPGLSQAIGAYAHYEDSKQQGNYLDFQDILTNALRLLDPTQPYPGAGAEGQRGRAGAPKQPALPQGWLDSRELLQTQRSQLTEGEGDTTGG